MGRRATGKSPRSKQEAAIRHQAQIRKTAAGTVRLLLAHSSARLRVYQLLLLPEQAKSPSLYLMGGLVHFFLLDPWGLWWAAAPPSWDPSHLESLTGLSLVISCLCGHWRNWDAVLFHLTTVQLIPHFAYALTNADNAVPLMIQTPVKCGSGQKVDDSRSSLTRQRRCWLVGGCISWNYGLTIH